MKKLLPIVLLLVGSGAGVGAGIFLRPEPVAVDVSQTGEEDYEPQVEEVDSSDDREGNPTKGREYLKLSNQFVVPIVQEDRIASMVVMTLSVEVPEGQGQAIYDIEPKIRDEFLRVLFDHAAIGGFDGAFLNNGNLDVIRRSLRNVAYKTFGKEVISDVLIFEIARQDY